jgi:hypothetical protein
MPVVSRTFAAMRIKNMLVKLELLADARVIQVKMYAKNATGLMGQVACKRSTAISDISDKHHV